MGYNIFPDFKTFDAIDMWRRKRFYPSPGLDNDLLVYIDVLKTLQIFITVLGNLQNLQDKWK